MSKHAIPADRFVNEVNRRLQEHAGLSGWPCDFPDAHGRLATKARRGWTGHSRRIPAVEDAVKMAVDQVCSSIFEVYPSLRSRSE